MTNKTPVVLHHGLFAPGERQLGPVRTRSFPGIHQAIERRGHPVMATTIHPSAGIVTRAGQLRDSILRFKQTTANPAERVVVVAHSLGGLDARYMVRHLDMADHVQAIVTISTPHRGSPWADWCTLNIGHRMGLFALTDRFGIDLGGAVDVTVERCQTFNQSTPDHPDVRYYSIGAALPWKKIAAPLLTSHLMIRNLEGDNDGLVSLSSSRWGEHLTDWPCDHWSVINRRFLRDGTRPQYDISAYYLQMLDELERRAVPRLQ